MPRAPASAPQPAHGADVRMQIAPDLPQGDRCSAPQPAQYVDRSDAQFIGYGELCVFLFYNIGWQANSKRSHHTKENLADEICEMVIAKGAHAIGICEIFNLRETHLDGKREIIMSHVLLKLNDGLQQPVWTGKTDGHYMFLWNTEKLLLIMYKYISCEVRDAPWRMAQYLQFQHTEKQTGPPLHVCHCHSPSSDNQKETPTKEQIIKKLTDDRRVTIFKALWKQVQINNPLGAGAPVAIFGGDYNCTDLQWSYCLSQASETQDSRRRIQRCVSSYSASFQKVHKGDRAIVFNGYALQQDSHWGKKLVPREMPINRLTSRTTMTPCSFSFAGDSTNSGT